MLAWQPGWRTAKFRTSLFGKGSAFQRKVACGDLRDVCRW